MLFLVLKRISKNHYQFLESSLPLFIKKIRPILPSQPEQEERLRENVSLQIKDTFNESDFEESKFLDPLLEPLVELAEFLVSQFLLEVIIF